jgi:hypothetical protein
MKVKFAALYVGWMACGLAQSQEDVPPPFDRIVNKNAIEQADIHDPFDPETEAPKHVRAQLEYIDLSHKDLTRLMMQEKTTRSDATALRMKVQDMVDKNVAKVIDTQMVVSRLGQKSTTESRKELIYPTEYESTSPAPTSEDDKAVKEVPKPVGSGYNAALPSCFETRNVGSSFEIEPNIGENNKIIDIRFLYHYVWHTGNTTWHETKSPEKNVYKIETPDFYLINIDTSVTTIAGQYFLAGVVSPKDAKGQADPERKVMVFLKCDVLASVP